MCLCYRKVNSLFIFLYSCYVILSCSESYVLTVYIPFWQLETFLKHDKFFLIELN